MVYALRIRFQTQDLILEPFICHLTTTKATHVHKLTCTFFQLSSHHITSDSYHFLSVNTNALHDYLIIFSKVLVCLPI